jgi:Domain of unknown function (DUF4838)
MPLGLALTVERTFAYNPAENADRGEVMKKVMTSILSSASILLAFAALSATAQIVIAEKGRPAAEIIVSPDAGPTEKYAADELAFFLHFMVGAPIPVAAAGSAEAAAVPEISRLLVGEGAVRLADPEFSSASLKPEEIIVRSQGHDLLLAGGSPRGTLYAVYTFLEDVLGCRWWTPTAWRIPRKHTLSIPSVAIRYAPPLEYREPFWFVAFDPEWAARNKANGTRAGGDDLRGGRHVYEGFVHTFYSLISPAEYFDVHPEWFSEIKGERTCDNAQLCLTNEAMRQEFVRNLKLRLRDNPAATIASVSQNDCYNNCTCPKCRAVDEEEGSPAGSLLRFVNAVAADIGGDFPNVAIDTLAYQYTRKPPRLTRPRPNVIVRLCSIECSFGRPLDDPANAAFLGDIEGWSKIAGRLFIWDYTTNFSHYIQPHPNYGVLAPNIRLFVKHNVTGIFEQGAYQSWGSEMAELRAWVLAKLLWNPALDAAALRREFLTGYYGPAGERVAAYLALLEAARENAGDKLGCYSPTDAKFLGLDTMLEARSILEAAAKSVASAPELARRIRRAQLPVEYVVLGRWDEYKKEAAGRNLRWPWPASREDLLARFLSACRSEGVTMISEWQTLEDWAAKGGRTR